MEVGVKSKRIVTDAAVPVGSDEAGGVNCHWRAAFSAAVAKNWLGAGAASSAVETVPSGLICTRTLMRTVPRMVERDFSETSGRTLRTTVGDMEFALEVAGWEERDAGCDAAVDGSGLTALLRGFPFGVEGEGFGTGELFGGGVAEAAGEFVLALGDGAEILGEVFAVGT